MSDWATHALDQYLDELEAQEKAEQAKANGEDDGEEWADFTDEVILPHAGFIRLPRNQIRR